MAQTDYLRLSVTDNCNLRCIYCRPSGPVTQQQSPEERGLLEFDEIVRLVRLFAMAGVRRIRLTGGEPLVRRNLPELVAALRAVDGIRDISLTTNGVLLGEQLTALREAGLHRINVSLDTLRRDRLKQIAGFDRLDQILSGIEAAGEAGFSPLKINTVLMRGINHDEVEDFVRFGLNYGLNIRFIEFFPVNERVGQMADLTVSNSEVRAGIEEVFGPLIPDTELDGGGPAENWRLARGDVRIGFISNCTSHFCDRCSRLRLDSRGGLAPCLFAGVQADPGAMLRRGAGDAEILEKIRAVIASKPDFTKQTVRHSIEMSSVGG